ncbi:hypothetical protein G6F70_004117 [Rhizopus microsporus]|uniref:GRIP domain-containing protein n=2 Tax=Rhizopus TaxID=4842 RepID=A0A367J8I1_RHIAZ|nr:hypothetical protein G6F71_007319 [Rhizopus microsporus]RCH86243.1 hypothetical protein CU097_007831 [Rhizopus azygosporus]KAG1200371.1 hypothetical protein G6F70_004117 [Rhizopus microsporus]KAG1209448.1 hypothetical protein G6F69_006353 [Rhizopus microsporus]KAG1230934.1 hypothetical protein G6F67_006122 [Rhizopus microsporus]
MSAVAEEVETLKSKLKEYEKKEASWKEEHAQLLNFQKKLTQAGSHLKALTQENANLSKKVTEEKKQREELSKEINDLKTKLDDTKKGHQKEIKQLVDILETAIDEEHKNIPDVSTSTLLDSYIKSVQKRIPKKAANAPLSQAAQDDIETSLKNILQDPENGTIEDSSITPSLRLTLEQVRSDLRQLQNTVNSHQSNIDEVQKDLKRQITQLNITNNELSEEKEKLSSEKEELESQIESLERQLSDAKNNLTESENKRDSLHKEHQSLIGKLAHIKETLTPRLEQDKQLREKVSELTNQLDAANLQLEDCQAQLNIKEQEHIEEQEKQQRAIRNLSQQVEELRTKCEEYESMTMEMDVQCSQVQEKLQKTQTELEALKIKLATEQAERESEKTSLTNLQTVLEEFQATKDAEMQAAIEHVQKQLDVAKKSWKEYEQRALTAEAALEKYQQGVEKAERYEKEIKEKNLLIGKLRHEAIILNEHLVEAMRKLKEEASEDSVDRQLISNLLIGFLNTPRGDRKRYDILTIIANVLHLTEEEKEQIGLLRPKQSLGSPPPTAIEQPATESFTDAWISFLLKESSPLRRNRSAVTLSSTENHIDL